MKRIKFLDYTIVNSENSDGWVITKPSGELYECNLGNYDDLDSAQKDCIIYFMIARPEMFATQIHHLTTGSQTWGSYSYFKRNLEIEGLNMPEEITCEGASRVLGYKGIQLKEK